MSSFAIPQNILSFVGSVLLWSAEVAYASSLFFRLELADGFYCLLAGFIVATQATGESYAETLGNRLALSLAFAASLVALNRFRQLFREIWSDKSKQGRE